MDALDGLDNISRKTYQRCDASVEQVVRDLKSAEGFGKHNVDQPTSVNSMANIKVGDICANDQQVITEKNDTLLLLFVEGNRLPTSLSHLRRASLFSTENLICIRRPNIVLQ